MDPSTGSIARSGADAAGYVAGERATVDTAYSGGRSGTPLAISGPTDRADRRWLRTTLSSSAPVTRVAPPGACSATRAATLTW